MPPPPPLRPVVYAEGAVWPTPSLEALRDALRAVVRGLARLPTRVPRLAGRAAETTTQPTSVPWALGVCVWRLLIEKEPARGFLCGVIFNRFHLPMFERVTDGWA